MEEKKKKLERFGETKNIFKLFVKNKEIK